MLSLRGADAQGIIKSIVEGRTTLDLGGVGDVLRCMFKCTSSKMALAVQRAVRASTVWQVVRPSGLLVARAQGPLLLLLCCCPCLASSPRAALFCGRARAGAPVSA